MARKSKQLQLALLESSGGRQLDLWSMLGKTRGSPPLRAQGKVSDAQRLENELSKGRHGRQAERLLARGRASDAERLAAELGRRKR